MGTQSNRHSYVLNLHQVIQAHLAITCISCTIVLSRCQSRPFFASVPLHVSFVVPGCLTGPSFIPFGFSDERQSLPVNLHRLPIFGKIDIFMDLILRRVSEFW